MILVRLELHRGGTTWVAVRHVECLSHVELAPAGTRIRMRSGLCLDVRGEPDDIARTLGEAMGPSLG